MLNAAGHEAHQVVVAAADQVALQHFVHMADVRFKFGEVFAFVVAQGDFGEHGNRFGDFCEVEVRLVTGDVPSRLQTFDALQARARGKPDGVGQADVGHAPVFLEFYQDIDINPIQFDQAFHYLPLVLPFTVPTF
ncbi:Unknown protein sequence [Pseudomonas syringae pv. maculicola]|nr:Unknown protein sequence [Pseudomonas syringae pv. maculicola]